ncbi:MAG: Ribosomal protein methyltransferase [Acidimicrobiales bacterium]|nr:Ribosomal protein methyltransferase [Acidimicrobiales bacterium]
MDVVIATSAADVDAVIARVGDLGGCSADVIAPSDARRVVVVSDLDDFEAARISATLRAEGVIAVTRPSAGVALEAWRRHTEPIVFGDRLSVCLAWSEHARSTLPGLIELGLGGFGTGEHPSTRLVIEAMMQRVRGDERLLDVGCGSGVLGLCALRLGAARVVAVDLKPEAVEATRRNAALNGLSDRIDASNAPLREIDGPFDIIVANVGRAAIVALAPDIVRPLAPGGWLAISGITPPQCTQVAAFLDPLVEIGRQTSGEWAALLLSGAGERG